MHAVLSRLLLCCTLMLPWSMATAQTPAPTDTTADVDARERAFARTMAERDLEGFARFIDAEAVFFSGDTALRGRDAIITAWGPYFAGAQPPFSWAPDQVEVLASGQLALTSGPVRDPQGVLIGRFNSVWRRGDDAIWRVVFDKGCTVCQASLPPADGCEGAAPSPQTPE